MRFCRTFGVLQTVADRRNWAIPYRCNLRVGGSELVFAGFTSMLGEAMHHFWTD